MEKSTRRIITASEARAMSDNADSCIKELSKAISQEAKYGHISLEWTIHDVSMKAIKKIINTFASAGYNVIEDTIDGETTLKIAW